MAPYRQSCPCRGRTLAQYNDLNRYEREARAALRMSERAEIEAGNLARRIRAMREDDEDRFSRLKIADLEREEQDERNDARALLLDARSFDRRAQRIRIALLTNPGGECHICGGSGVQVGNGSAAIGGNGRAVAGTV